MRPAVKERLVQQARRRVRGVESTEKKLKRIPVGSQSVFGSGLRRGGRSLGLKYVGAQDPGGVTQKSDGKVE